jgi:hypothetical protein
VSGLGSSPSANCGSDRSYRSCPAIAIGTALKKTAGVGVATPNLPVQAIVPDKDTWIDGDFGFLDRAN